MEQLTYTTLGEWKGYLLRQAPERVLQFGEGNFLRGFADHFIDVMNERAGFNGKAVVVPPASTGKAARINAQEGLYQLCLRGKYDGAVVNDRRIISCISRGLDVFTDWEELLRTARSPATGHGTIAFPVTARDRRSTRSAPSTSSPETGRSLMLCVPMGSPCTVFPSPGFRNTHIAAPDACAWTGVFM